MSDSATAQTPMDRLDAIVAVADADLVEAAPALADELLAIGEAALESWLLAKGKTPTGNTVEGFRLLALHRQGARGDATFNACRETCRELAYAYNCIRVEPAADDIAQRVRLAAMVARHLVLFIDGKLEVAGLGEFCCASRPLRLNETAATVHT